MGTIVERRRRDGTAAYLAQISLTRKGQPRYTENQTFDRRPAATAWLKRREYELKNGGPPEPKAPTLDRMIDKYIESSVTEIGRTKAQVLRSIKNYEIAKLECDKITSQTIVAFAQELSDGREPSTVLNYLSHLQAIFSIADAAWGARLDPKAMKDALAVTRRLGLTRKARGRSRRPSLAELDAILSYFEQSAVRAPSSIPMTKVIVFALFSTRRQEEITRAKWADLDHEGSRMLVRDMKNPGEKIGNDVWVDLPPEALRVIDAMPKSADQIFPFNCKTISARFTRAIKVLGIDDLRFHDLRHEGVTRLFEIGYSVPKAAAVSGHRSWASLQGYTHVRQVGDKYKNWVWLDRVSTQAKL